MLAVCFAIIATKHQSIRRKYFIQFWRLNVDIEGSNTNFQNARQIQSLIFQKGSNIHSPKRKISVINVRKIGSFRCKTDTITNFPDISETVLLRGDDMRKQRCKSVNQNLGYYLVLEVGKGCWPGMVNNVGLLGFGNENYYVRIVTRQNPVIHE